MNIRPRLDFVVIRISNRGVSAGGVVIPDVSKAGKVKIVVAVGPDVEDLKVGDSVEVLGTVGEAAAFLPDQPDTFLTRQSNVAIVYEDTRVVH